jgi:hypothetical protein
MSYLVPKQYTYLNVARIVLPPLTFTCLLWMTSINPVNLWQLALCVALLVIPWSSYLRWQREMDDELPVFSMLSLMYWLYYAVALFWGDLTIRMARFVFGHESSPKFLSLALVMCLLGIAALWVGMKSRIGRRIVPSTTPYLNEKRGQRNYLRAVLVASALLGVFEPSTYVLGEGGRQLISIALSFIPLLAFTVMFRLYLRREATQLDKLLVFGFLMVRLVVGLSSGWLANAASIMIICAAAYIAERHKIPRLAVLTVLLFTLFFQVGKEDFRSVYWYQQTQATQIDRVSFWINASLEKWQKALTDSSGSDFRELLNKSVSRVSLLAQSANVLEETPKAVPYQYGQLYSYLLITFIPRFVWPEKPSVSEANRFYQVTYGLTAEEDLNNVAIGVGILTESYISFGWIGVIGIMFLVGIFFDFYQTAFLSKTSGVLMTSLGIALLPQMLGIESQMAAYVGGIVQQVGLSLLVFLPIIKWRREPRPRFRIRPTSHSDQSPTAIAMNAGVRS